MAFDRNALRQGLGNAAQESANRATEGPSFRNYIKRGCPRPQMKKLAEGKHIIDIIPFIPTEDFGTSCKKGQPTYVLEVYTHQNIGPANDTIICPASTLGKPCPICDDLRQRQEAGEDIKKKLPRYRVVYNVWPHDATREKENAGVHLLEMSHFSMETNILAIGRDGLTGEWLPFSDPDNGRVLIFYRKGTGATNTRYEGFQWAHRPQPIPDAILQQALPLNEWVEVLSYEEIAAKWFVEQRPDSAPQAVQSRPAYYGAVPVPAAPAYDYGAIPQEATTAPAAYAYAAPAPQPVEASTEKLPWDEVPASAPSITTPPPAAPVKAQLARSGVPAQAPTQQTPPASPRPAAPAPAQNLCPLAEDGGIFGKTLDFRPQQCGVCAIWDNCAMAFDEHNAAQTSAG